MTEPTYYYLAALISSASWIFFLWTIKDIRILGVDTDNEKQIYAAAQSHKWKWLSDMHKYGVGKTSMKDGMILLLSVFQKIFRNNWGEKPLAALSGFSVAVSGYLIFLVGNNYWDHSIGLFLMILFLASAWLWQIALFGGHINVGTMMFLTIILLIQQMPFGNPDFMWLFLAGMAFCFMMFSSASSSKFIPLIFSGLFFSKFGDHILGTTTADTIKTFLTDSQYSFDICMVILIILFFLALKINLVKIVDILYDNRYKIVRNINIIRGQSLFDKQHYVNHANKKLKIYFKNLLISYVIASIVFHSLGASYLWPLLAGFLVMFLIFTLPDVKTNTKKYIYYLSSPMIKTHFKEYIEYFSERGLSIKRDFRGAGWIWIPRIFWRMSPTYTLFFISIFLISILAQPEKWATTVILAIVSISPILWGELTGGPQLSRTYSVSIAGLLIFFGYFLMMYDLSGRLLIIAPIILITIAHESWVYFTDIYPARMAIPNLIKALDSYGIKEIHTYNTKYNDVLVNALDIEPPVRNKYKVNFIESITDVNDGWIVIPGTSSKVPHMDGVPEAVKGGDYTKDKELNRLLNTRQIEKIAQSKFKTFGTSRIWTHESEVTSFMDLIRREITADDRYRGYAWLIHSSKIKGLIHNDNN